MESHNSSQQTQAKYQMNIDPEQNLPSQNKSIKSALIIFSVIVFVLILGIVIVFGKHFLPSKTQIATNSLTSQEITPMTRVPSPTPDILKGWLTYTSTVFMGSEVNFRYPPLFRPGQEGEGQGGGRSIPFYAKDNSYIEFGRDFECNYSPGPSVQLPIATIDDCIGAGTSTQPHTKMSIDGREAIEFSNIESAQDVGKMYVGTDFTALFLSEDKKSIYSFFIHINSTDPQKIKDGYALFQQILSTVSFN